MKLPRRHFCIWRPALPRCRPCRGSRGRKPIRRGRCAWSSASPPAARPDIDRAPDRPSGSPNGSASTIMVENRAGRQRQHRRRSGDPRRRPTATRFHGRARRTTRSTRRSTTSSRSTSCATSRRSPASCACPMCMEVHPSVPAKIGSGVHRLRQGQSRTRSTWRPAAPARPSHVAGELFKMMTGVNMVHVPYRGVGARDRRSRRRPGRRSHVRQPAGVDRAHPVRQAARARGDDGEALAGAAGICRPSANSCRASRRAPGSASARPRRRPPAIVDRLNKAINAGLADPKIRARLAELGGTTFRGRPPISASWSPKRPRNGPR